MNATATYELLADLGGGLIVAMVDVDRLREQDENARVMDPQMFNQLVANVKRRGTLESLPYCVQTSRGVEIVSGHHRTRAARAAGLFRIAVLLDTNRLTRSAITAKQVAHNSLQGVDDRDVLRRLAMVITDVDDLLEAYLPQDIKVEPDPAEMARMLAPHVTFNWKLVALMFLPHQFEAFEELRSVLDSKVDLAGIAPLEEWEPLVLAIEKVSRAKGVVSIGTVVSVIIGTALRYIREGVSVEELMQRGDDDDTWVSWAEVTGSEKIPLGMAKVVRQLVEKMLADGSVSENAPWQAIEMVAADYLAGA